MPSSKQSNHDADDMVSVVTLTAEELDDSSSNTKLLIILTSFLIAIAFPTLLYFFAPYQLIPVGSALLNSLTIQASVTASLITGALVIGTGIFTVFSFIGAAVSYIFEDAKPSESTLTTEEREEDALAADSDKIQEVTAEVTLPLPAVPDDIPAPSPQHSGGSVLPPPATAPGATLGTVAAAATGSATVTTTADPATAPGSAVETIAAKVPGATVVALPLPLPSATNQSRVKADKIVLLTPTEEVSATVGSPTTTVTAHSTIPVAIVDAFNTAKSFMIQYPTAFYFGGGMLALATLYPFYQFTSYLFAPNSITANVGGTFASAVTAAFSTNASVTCLYRPTGTQFTIPVPIQCPEGSATVIPEMAADMAKKASPDSSGFTG